MIKIKTLISLIVLSFFPVTFIALRDDKLFGRATLLTLACTFLFLLIIRLITSMATKHNSKNPSSNYEDESSITKIKILQTSLDHLANEQKAILETANIGFLKVIDLKIVWINHKTEEMLQYSKDELIGKSTQILYPSEETYSKFAESYAIMTTGKIYETEAIVLKKDGTPLEVHFNGKAINPSDPSMGVLWVLEDCTARNQTDRALRASEEKYRIGQALLLAVAEGTSDGIYVKDTSGRYLLVNSAAANFFGHPVKEILGKDDTFIFPQQEAEKIIASDKNAITKLPETYEEAHIIAGMQRFFSITKGPVFNSKGIAFGTFGISREITAHRHSEDKIKNNLREKEILLKEINHRVKNNMAIISSLLSFQAANVKDKSIQEALAEGQRRINSMALIHQQLYSSKNLAQVDFGQFVKTISSEIAETFRWQEKKPNININVQEITLDIALAIPCALIVNELLTNAFKYAFPSSSNWPDKTISITMEHHQNKNFLLSIADNGHGLPKEKQWRQSNALGLQLVIALVEQIKGNLKILSTS